MNDRPAATGRRAARGKEAARAIGGLGTRIQALRKAKRLSLRALAASVEVTPSLISQIERGRTSPSVASLYAIAAALDVPVDVLFGGPAVDTPVIGGVRTADRAGLEGADATGEQRPAPAWSGGASRPRVVRRGLRRRIDIDGYGGRIAWELLTPEPEALGDFIEIVYEPGASSAPDFMRHAGREYGVILEGQLWVTLGFEEVVLGPGDSIAFVSATPHRFENRGVVPVKAIWLVMREEGFSDAAPSGGGTG